MSDSLIELNVGGTMYTTTTSTLLSEPDSFFTLTFNINKNTFDMKKDSSDRFFIDRDGKMFHYILEYLRNKIVLLPDNFAEKRRLRFEADFFGMKLMVKMLDDASSSDITGQLSMNTITPSKPLSGCIIVGYRGTFANGRDGLVDVKFRKISRILVCGRVALCREAFGESLNESRDPDHGVSDRYTSRYYLKHASIEQAFDALYENGFKLICAAATGANSGNQISERDITNKHHQMNTDNEENKWLHYNEYVFSRE